MNSKTAPLAAKQATELFNAGWSQEDILLLRPVETYDEGGQRRSHVLYKAARYWTVKMLWPERLETFHRQISKQNANSFFSVCPRFGAKGFDLAWQIRTVRVLWSDVDNCGSQEELMKRIEAAGLPHPSAIVRSGHGFHLYWFLSEAYLIDDVADPPQVKTEWVEIEGKRKPIDHFEQNGEKVFLKDPNTGKSIRANMPELSAKAIRVQDIVAGIAAAIGGDSTQDLSRLLRVPGSMNLKNARNGQTPVPCELVELSGEAFPLSAFERFAKESPHAKRREKVAKVKLPSKRKITGKRQDRINQLILACDTAEIGERSEADFALACWAVENGMDRDELWNQVSNVGKFGERGREYFDRTIAKAEGRTREKIFKRANTKSTKHQQPAENTGTDNEPIRPANVSNKVIRNHEVADYDENGNPIYVPISMGDILADITRSTDGWPRRVGSALFVDQFNGEISWLMKSAALTGWLGSRCGNPSQFRKSMGFHTENEIFEELKRTSKDYIDVETLPHHPFLENVYYACGEVTPRDGKKLNELVERFNPETPIDRDLIVALFVSPGWGGAGNRPAFGITSDDGRGSGKTTLAKMVGRLWGGRIEISPDESCEIIKQRLLSPDGMTKRVVNIDNLKSLKFSNAGLEALITADVISGKRMYYGEAQRPNNLTWITTLNGISFATDMAQRSVTIKIRRPTYSGNWQDETEAFIDANRDAIIADCIGFLMRPADYRLETYTRWGNWERDILSRLPEPGEAQKVIMERQGAADAEGEETSDFEEAVRHKLLEAGYSPDEAVVFIPSKLAAECLSEVTGERCGTTKATRTIGQRIVEGRLPRIVRNTHNGYGRGFIWQGKEAGVDEKVNTDLETRLKRNRESTNRSF